MYDFEAPNFKTEKQKVRVSEWILNSSNKLVIKVLHKFFKDFRLSLREDRVRMTRE